MQRGEGENVARGDAHSSDKMATFFTGFFVFTSVLASVYLAYWDIGIYVYVACSIAINILIGIRKLRYCVSIVGIMLMGVHMLAVLFMPPRDAISISLYTAILTLGILAMLPPAVWATSGSAYILAKSMPFIAGILLVCIWASVQSKTAYDTYALDLICITGASVCLGVGNWVYLPVSFAGK
jgi:hypothetical protein